MKFNNFSTLFRGTFVSFAASLLVSCSTLNYPVNLEVEGGPDSRIVGKYKFVSSSKYLEFYQIFKEHNLERFLCPIDFNYNSFIYYFRTEGIKLSDFESNRYDLDFDLMNMYFEFEFESNKITFETFEINDTNFMNGFSVSYEFLESNNETQVYYFVNDFLFASTCWINNDLVFNEEFINKLEGLTIFLEEGIKYVF